MQEQAAVFGNQVDLMCNSESQQHRGFFLGRLVPWDHPLAAAFWRVSMSRELSLCCGHLHRQWDFHSEQHTTRSLKEEFSSPTSI